MMPKKNKTGQTHMLQEELEYSSIPNWKDSHQKHFCKLLVQKLSLGLTEALRTPTAHTVLTGKVSFPHFWHRTPGSALPRRPSCVRTDKRTGHKRRDASQLLKNSQCCYWFLPAVSKRNAAFISFTGLQNVAIFSCWKNGPRTGVTDL